MDRGIIFSAPMILALLAGRKTQTRRLIKPIVGKAARPGDIIVSWPAEEFVRQGAHFRPPWQAGDRLYVREAMRFWAMSDDAEITYLADGRRWQTSPCAGEIADDRLPSYFRLCDASQAKRKAISRPSIHMPRWASRLWLAVESVRIERLQDITREDCVAEGHPRSDMPGISEEAHLDAARDWFMDLWGELHLTPGTGWGDNPWIIRTAFDVHRGNIDRDSQS